MVIADVPLCVDLDGTLIRSDLLVESALRLLYRNPLNLFWLPIWIARGKANLKRQVAKRVKLDPACLPYNVAFVAWLRTIALSRKLVLCTAADDSLAELVAGYIGGFAAVIASDGVHNLTGTKKGLALSERFGDRGFDYAGNHRNDLAVWRYARRAIVVNGGRRVVKNVGCLCELERVFDARRNWAAQWARALRLHQWLKNALVFLPLLAAHEIFNGYDWLLACGAFLCFGLLASATYIVNDLLDLDADRRHPRKRNRPFAAGTLALTQGMVAVPVLLILTFVLASAMSLLFAAALAIYLVLTVSYSLRLKQVVILDVIILAGLYTLRVIAGAVVTGVPASFWLLTFSMFIFFSLALLKRYAELLELQTQGGTTSKLSRRGYRTDDLPLLQTFGGAAGYLSVVVLALYINSETSKTLYTHPVLLWLLCPLLLYWISRAWMVTHRGAMHDDPVIYAVTNKASLAVLLIGVAVVILAV